MRRVLIILYTLGVGGVEKVCYEIASHINKEKYRCDFLVATEPEVHQHYENILINLGCKVFKGGEIRDQNSKKRFLQYEKELLKNEHYDVVHSNMDFMNVWTMKCAREMRVSIRISHVHTMLKNQTALTVREWIKRQLYKRMLCYYANYHIGCSKAVVKEYYGNANAEVIINGFDTHSFAALDKEASGEKRLITVGRLSNAKNPEFILSVMKELVAIDNSYELLWIGDGEKRAAIDALIREYKLIDNVILAGETTDVATYLQQCHVAIFPSKFEGLGIAIVEAQLAKCLTYYSDIVPEEAEVGFGVRLPLCLGAKQWAQRIHQDIQSGNYTKHKLIKDRVEFYDVQHMIDRIERIYG